jgi:site-specific DNA-methyltransferase (adenine-specific)
MAGSIELHCGDCLDVMRTMADGSVDAVITDPPYSTGGAYRGDRMALPSVKYQRSEAIKHLDYTGDNRDQRSWAFWCALWLSECRRIARPSAPIVMFCDWRQLATATDVLQAGGWVWRGIACWDKTLEARPQKGRFRAQAEFMVWGSNGPMPLEQDRPCLPGVFRHATERPRHHMNQKPVALMEEVVGICPPRGTILDPFAGTGTTGVAALATGRSFVGIDLNPAYLDLARERIAAAEAA